MIKLGFSQRQAAPELPSDDDGEPSLCQGTVVGTPATLPTDVEDCEDLFGPCIEYNSLLDTTHELTCVPLCTCVEGCVAKFLENRTQVVDMQQLRATFQQKPKHVQDDVLFELVKACMFSRRDQNCKKRWSLCGQLVCRRAFCNLLGIGRERLKKLKEATTLKHLRPLEDQRKYNLGNSANMLMNTADVDAFFSFLYQYSAESLADADEDAIETTSAITDLLEYALGRRGDIGAQATIGLGGQKVNRKWLPHMSIAELFDMYLAHGNTTNPKAGKTVS